MTRISTLAILLIPSAPLALAEVSFNRDIRPIMSDTCFRCHGPDKSSRMAGLRLDIRDEALQKTKSGVTPIVPGDVENSAIVQRVFAKGPKIMPPVFAHKELTEKQKQTIKQWVAEGAKYEGHWAYQPIVKPELPQGYSGNPIDYFIRARLDKEDLKPAPEADKRTLIRRVSLDVTGIPPTPEEVQAFVDDSLPDAYEKLVDRLLASPRYAEMQTMRWLDAVRYADTCGFHGDNPFPAWPYRDYVLRSFRDNKPFDVFTREQIAGDLMPDAGVEQKVASAYNRLTRTSAEGGLQPKEYIAKYGADRVRTTSAVWLGSTMGCAECHDHKFDPFTSKDFYSFKAFFSDIKEEGLVMDRGPEAWGSQLKIPTPEQAEQMMVLTSRLDEVNREIAGKAENLEPGGVLDRLNRGELSWRVQYPLTAKSKNGAQLSIHNQGEIDSTFDYRGSLVTEKNPADGTVIADGENPDNDMYTVTFKPGAGKWTSLGLEVIPDESLPGLRYARGADRFVLTNVTIEAAGKRVPVVLATESSHNLSVLNDMPPMAAIDDDPTTGWGVSMHGGNLVLALRFGDALTTSPNSLIKVQMNFDSKWRRATIGRFRMLMSSGEYSWPVRHTVGSRKLDNDPDGLPDAVVKALKDPSPEKAEEQKKAVQEYLTWTSKELQPLVIEKAKLETQIGILDAQIARVVVTEATKPRETRVLARGNFLDDTGEIVEPAIPGFLGKVPTEGRATRLDLANWLVSKDNPLTARVYVNRAWRQLFGTGLSKQLDDLGSQGELPTHPELLDWLAADFRDGWDMKKLARTIVTSQTYKQSSVPTPEMTERDPDNRLLARQSRFRVDAEIVRDIALSASGLLTEKFGGPSVKPYEPDGYLGALNFPKREYSASHGDDLYRRGVYTTWQRTYLHPSLLTFDAPTREECAVNRTSSNTPLQALDLLNDPTYIEAARVLAQSMLTVGGATKTERINWAIARAMGRPATAEERRILVKLYQDSATEFRARPATARQLLSIGDSPINQKLNPVELAAATNVARAILNLHETITRN